MKRWSFKEKCKYRFDNIMSKGTAALISLLFAITLLVAIVIGILAVLAGGEGGVGSQIWISLMHALDAGTLAGDALDNIPYIVLMSLVTLCGLFITSILIGIITTAFEDKFQQLRKGASKVLEEGHTVILGFNENIYTLLDSLIEANANQKDGCIVIAGEEEKETMEEEIRESISDFKTTRVICRSGVVSKSHTLEKCSLESCRSIIINSYDDASTIKTILAVSAYLSEKQLYNPDLYMTAVIVDEQNVDAARIAGGDRIEVVYAKDAISRIIAHTCGEPGLSNVIVELFDYGGDELYFETVPQMYGKTFKEVLNSFTKAVVFGIRKASGAILNPPMDLVVEEGDKVILLEEDDGAFQVSLEKQNIQHELIIESNSKQPKKANSLLILGYNERLEGILKEYDQYEPEGSLVTLVHPESLNLETQSYKNIHLNQICEEQTCRDTLEESLTKGADSILILSNDLLDDEAADAETILQLIFLRDISEKTGKRFSVTSEMRNSDNQRLVSVEKAEDFVIGSNIINLLMAQITENRELAELFEDILDEEGSEIYMKPVGDYVCLNTPVNFYTVTESAARKGQIAVGYKKIVDGRMEIITNPLKTQDEIFGEGDYLIVIAED